VGASALVAEYPAVDTVNDGTRPPPAKDQRGVSRLQDGNGDGGPMYDIGAFALTDLLSSQRHSSAIKALAEHTAGNRDLATAGGVLDDMILMHGQPNGNATIAANAKVNISELPIIFFVFYFNPVNGNVLFGMSAAGTGPTPGGLPEGYRFTRNGTAQCVLTIPVRMRYCRIA